MLPGLTPLTGNRDFLPGVYKSLFHRWHGKGIGVVGDLFLDNTLMSFNWLKDKFELDSSTFWGYLQDHYFINSSNVKPPEDRPVYCHIDDFLLIIFGAFGRKISILSISMLTGYIQSSLLDAYSLAIDAIHYTFPHRF